MKNEDKNKLFVGGLFFCLLAPLLGAVFLFPCQANETLKITAVQFDGGSGRANEDFVEITNKAGEVINLGNYRLAKITSSGKRYNIKSWADDNVLQPGEKYVWACSKDDFAQSIGANGATTATISSSNTIVIISGSLNGGAILDSFSKKPNSEESSDGNKKSSYTEKVKINEIYPSPDIKAGEEEFIEIKNISAKNIDISNWTATDSIHEGKPDKNSFTLKPGALYAFKGKFYLNSSDDTARIFDAKGNLVNSVSYAKGKSRFSYSFDGNNWRWTSQKTPGEENRFDKILSGKIEMDDEIYAKIYADFSVKTDRDAQKFTWDFGDGHKSYLKSTRHKYEKPGKYNGSLRIRGNGEERTYTFTIKVEKYRAPKVRIIRISPNPQGNDTDNEWIEIKNKSGKKVNLIGWSVATGWDNLYNHPVQDDFEIKSGKSKKLTRKLCAFTLNNFKSNIELRDPTGKTVQKIKYDHGEKSVLENEIYQKPLGSRWIWISPPDTPPKIENKETTKDSSPLITISASTNQTPQEFLGKYTPSRMWLSGVQRRKDIANCNLKIALAETKKPRVLGVQTVKDSPGFIRDYADHYAFTTQTHRRHWATSFVSKVWMKINSQINRSLVGLWASHRN